MIVRWQTTLGVRMYSYPFPLSSHLIKYRSENGTLAYVEVANVLWSGAISERHPTFQQNCCYPTALWVVGFPRIGVILSLLCLIMWVWTYAQACTGLAVIAPVTYYDNMVSTRGKWIPRWSWICFSLRLP